MTQPAPPPKLLLVALLLVGSALLVLWVRGQAEGDGQSEPQLTPTTPLDQGPESSAPTLDEAAVRVEVPDSRPEAPAVVASEPVTELVADGQVLLRGTIVVTDPEGVEHATEDGSGRLVVWGGSQGTYTDVEVVGGRFELEVPADARIGSNDFTLGGRTAYVEGTGRQVPLPTGGLLELRARWVAEVLLHVVDADTGAELDGLEVRQDEVFAMIPVQRHPGTGGRRKLADVASPVALRPIALGKAYRESEVHARAPGYAWGATIVDHMVGGEYVLELERGGGLDVELIGDAADATLRLWLAPEGAAATGLGSGGPSGDGPLVLELGLGDEPSVAVDGLAPGHYTLGVELGEVHSDPIRLGEAQVDLFAGERTAVRIVLDERSQVELVALAGTLVLPAAWEIEPFALYLNLLDEPLAGQRRTTLWSLTPTEADPEAFTWDAGEVQPGRYAASLNDPLFREEFEVGPDGDLTLQLLVPAPADVLLDVVDAASGERVGLGTILWNVGSQPGGSTILKVVEADPNSGLFEFRVPPGEVFVAPYGGGLVGESQRFVARPGSNVWTLEVERGLGFRVVFRHGDAVVPVGGIGAFLMAHRTDAPGQSSSTTVARDGLDFRVPEPGTYRVHFPAYAGFQAPAPLEVAVVAGTFVEHVVQLERQP